MSNFPQDLINDILLLLPVKSLLRFRCVSKSLYTIIESKDFIDSHLNTSFKKRIHCKLIYNYYHNGTKKFRTLDINDGSVEEFQLNHHQMMPSITPWYASFCNGLLLISTTSTVHNLDPTNNEPFYYKFSVWNPSTRHYRELPDFPEILVNRPNSPYQIDREVSFGYDHTSGDYKVILIISDNDGEIQVWVLELRSSSCYWRRIQYVPYYIGFCYKNCFIDGFVHFLSCEDQDDYGGLLQYSIVAFDIAKETFSIVPMPNNYETVQGDPDPPHLQVFEGCLSIGLRTARNLDLYVMRKKELGGEEYSWIKLFSFPTSKIFYPRHIRILGYSKERDKILFSCGYTTIMYSYDVKEGSLQEIDQMENTGGWYSFLCVESLASVE